MPVSAISPRLCPLIATDLTVGSHTPSDAARARGHVKSAWSPESSYLRRRDSTRVPAPRRLTGAARENNETRTPSPVARSRGRYQSGFVKHHRPVPAMGRRRRQRFRRRRASRPGSGTPGCLGQLAEGPAAADVLGSAVQLPQFGTARFIARGFRHQSF